MQRLEGRVEALTIVIQGRDPRSWSETPHAMRTTLSRIKG